ncbi:hypothetical protein ACLKA6_013130 [Drosophila palustris]
MQLGCQVGGAVAMGVDARTSTRPSRKTRQFRLAGQLGKRVVETLRLIPGPVNSLNQKINKLNKKRAWLRAASSPVPCPLPSVCLPRCGRFDAVRPRPTPPPPPGAIRWRPAELQLPLGLA